MLDTRKIGIIIGQVKTSEFIFASNYDVNRLEYVAIESQELIETEEGNLEEINIVIISQIFEVWADSRALPEGLKIEDAEKIIAAGLADSKFFAKTRILGYLHEENVFQPRRAINPGNFVHMAPNELLEQFYSYPEEEGLHIGHLITRSDVPVHITVNGFRRHLSILAQTGGGKSYCAGVLAEELHQKGATIVIIDPHADYVFLGSRIDGTRIDRVNVFRTPQSTGRYSEADIGRIIQQYEVRFSDLTDDEICIVSGIRESFTRIRNAVQNALKNLRGNTRTDADRPLVGPDGYGLDDLLQELQDIDTSDSRNAVRYGRRIHRLGVFSDATTDISRIILPQQISVIDLSGLSDNVADYITNRILSEIYEQRRNETYPYPVFIFMEEAHRFLPNRGRTYSIETVKEISAEGRKFGVFLALITQRPYKIDQDALSQCNSQIILRITNSEDQNAIRSSSEKLSESLLNDLPGLNPGEAIIVGNLTRAPVMVKIRRRVTREGGADIDVVTSLRAAKEVVEQGEEEQAEQAREELEELREMME